jgi:hypothetical protein
VDLVRYVAWLVQIRHATKHEKAPIGALRRCGGCTGSGCRC